MVSLDTEALNSCSSPPPQVGVENRRPLTFACHYFLSHSSEFRSFPPLCSLSYWGHMTESAEAAAAQAEVPQAPHVAIECESTSSGSADPPAPAPAAKKCWSGWGQPAATNPVPTSSSDIDQQSASEGASKKSTALADIMAEEEADRAVKEIESEEERMMREALAASLLDAQQPDHPAFVDDEMDMDRRMSSIPAGTDTNDTSHDGLDEDMRRAIALSLQEQTPDSTPVAAAAAASSAAAASAAAFDTSSNMAETEAEQIARAIQEADDAEAAASLKLAMELQREEEVEAKREAASIQAARHQSGNVSTMDHDDFVYHRTGEDGEKDEGSRQLWGADDYDRYQEEHGAYERYQQQYGSNVDDDDDGFRMNSNTPSKNWSRLNRNIIVGPNNETRTKHDVKLKAQSNATRLLGREASGCRKGGKDVDGPIGISDQAYNSLKQGIKKRSTVKGVERHGTGRAENYGGTKTRGGAMDGNVRLLVTKAINTGLIDGCNGVVKEGKEAIVYHANAGEGVIDDDGKSIGGSDGIDVAVKVFKRIQEFKGRRAYVDGDPRYHGTKFRNIDPRKQVEVWAEKEYRNLIRANRAGVPVPTPLMQKENCLFMRFLGEDGWPSPQLREVDIKKGSKKWTTLYTQVMVAVRRLYHVARLVHGDLSEYNILLCPSYLIENNGIWERKEDTLAVDDSDESALEIVLIDLGQAVERQHPSARELLVRDLSMIRAFFIKQGIHVLAEEDAVEFILEPCQYEKEETFEEGNEEEKKCSTESCEDERVDECSSIGDEDDKEKTWRFEIPGWDDATDLERLQAELKATKQSKSSSN